MKFVSIAAALMLVFLFFYFVMNNQKNSDSSAVFRVGMVVPVVHAALEEIQKAFIEKLSSSIPVHIDVLNAYGDRVLLKTQAEHVVSGDYDLMVGIATQPTILLKELSVQRSVNTPLVGIAVDDPLGNKIIESMQASGGSLVVVTSYQDEPTQKLVLERQIDFLLKAKPTTQKVLLVYNPIVMLEQQKNILATLCAEKNITFSAIEVMSSAEIISKVIPVIAAYDTVIVLKDNTVVSAIEGLVELCDRVGVTLVVSDLNSGEKGAVLSSGVYEAEYGSKGADLALAILKEQRKPEELASLLVTNHYQRVNARHLQKQGILKTVEQLRGDIPQVEIV